MTANLGISQAGLVVAAGAVVLLGAVIALAGALWVRRRWRRLRLLLRGGPEAAVGSIGRSAWRWALGRPLPDRRWRAVARSRRELLLSVSAAERAVDVAATAGAPMGELRSLSRRLRKSADALDASLSVDQRRTARSGELPDTNRQVDDLLRAAAHIHESAARALTAVSGSVQTGLVEDAERELAAVSAGVGERYEGPRMSTCARSLATPSPGTRTSIVRES
jgi:hypothetical protein